MNIQKTIGRRVQQHRKRLGLTQAELAEEADLAPQTISRIERGALEPSVTTLVALAKVLSVSLDDLAGLYAKPDASSRLSSKAALLKPKTQDALIKLVGALIDDG